MKYSLIFAIVAGVIAVINGWIADFASPAFRVPDNVATEVTERIVDATETKEGQVTVSSEVMVSRVVDGDTIEVEFNDGERALVRYIGIDTPERERDSAPAECYYQEASARNEELVTGKIVRLEKDVSDTDQYGRLLRYVFVGEELINKTLLEEGMGIVVAIKPDVSRVNELSLAENKAKQAGVGIWSACAF